MKMERNLWTQSTLKNSHVPIIKGGATNITTATSNGTNVEFNSTVELKGEIPVQSKGRYRLGPVLGGLGIFIILVLYILGQRKEERKRKEKALQATRKEEMKRKFLKDNMNIKTCVGVSTPCIDDEEAQHQQKAIFKSRESQQQGGDEYCSTTDDSLDDYSHSSIGQSSSCSNMILHDVMCPICHEEFQDGDELASSKNEACCHTAFHSECIISWLTRDHEECPICRSEFVVENMESED